MRVSGAARPWRGPSSGNPRRGRGGAGARGGTEADTRRGTTWRQSLEGRGRLPPARGLQKLGQTHGTDVPPSLQRARCRPHVHSRPSRTDRTNPRGLSRPGLTVLGGPRAAGQGLAFHGRQSHKSNKSRSTCRVRLPREASTSSPWPSHPLHMQEMSWISVACSDPAKEKLTRWLRQH